MQLSDFNYHLPEHLIAKYPLSQRSQSRLLHLDSSGNCIDRQFTDIVDLLQAGDVLVLNDTKVMKARLFATKDTGGKAELLIERITSPTTAIAHIKTSNSPKAGSQLQLTFGNLAASAPITVTGRHNNLYTLSSTQPFTELLEQYGHLPLPPYFNRSSESLDDSRYQTVFNDHNKLASVAAPTAGLHFDQALLTALQAKGVIVTTVTLHVGSGTFVPVRTNNITEHHMHSEWGDVPADTVAIIEQCKLRGNHVIAVGTTATRALESAAKAHNGMLKPWQGETDIFIYPGIPTYVIDRLITNFHLPESTLLMLVSALAGRAPILAAYQHAIAQTYRFFSYGDAMLIDKAK